MKGEYKCVRPAGTGIDRAIMMGTAAVFFLCSFILHAGYVVGNGSTANGGGTWGAILKMSAHLEGETIVFGLQKKTGLMTRGCRVSLQTGTYGHHGIIIKSAVIERDRQTLSLAFPLANEPVGDREFFFRVHFPKGGYAWCGPITVTYSASIPLSPKAPVIVSATHRQITLRWPPVKDATQYRIYRSHAQGGEYDHIYWGPENTYTDKGEHLKPNNTYYYKISAGNIKGWSPLSADTPARMPQNGDLDSAGVEKKQ